MVACAWCNDEVGEPTTLNGVAFHWICLKRRMAVVHDEAQDRRIKVRKARRVVAEIRRRAL